MPKEIKRREFLKFLLISGALLSSGASAGTLLSGCRKTAEVSVEKSYFFLEHLEEADINTPRKEYVSRTTFSIKGETREVLFEHPDSQVTFKEVPIYNNAQLKFGIGINEAAWDTGGDGVLFEIILFDENAEQHPLYSRYNDPKKNPDDRKWFEEAVDLRAYEGESVFFAFKTSSGPNGNNTSDWAGWSTPQVNATKVVKVRGRRSPNVVLISIDTLRPDYLGCYGYPKNTSPNIDKLAGKGVLFKNCIAQSPWTLPSHMSILTSLYPAVHLANSRKNNVLSEEHLSLPEILKGEGYLTAAFVDGGWLNHHYGFDQGFGIYDDEGGRIAKINRKALDFLDNHFQEKFFLFLHVYDVHGPYNAPPPYDGMFYQGNKEDPTNHSMDFVKALDCHQYHKFGSITDINYVKALYAGAVSYVDSELGRLFAKMEALKILDNTLVVFLSDHGESLFEHHTYIGHGIFLHDTEVKIPLIIKPPEGAWRNRIIDEQVESIDVMPTILDLLNLPANKAAQGRSLTLLIKDKEPGNKDTFAFGESSNTGGTGFVRTNTWKYISEMRMDVSELIQGMKPSKEIDLSKYILAGEQLYDLAHDPRETENLIKQQPARADEFRGRLTQWEEHNRERALQWEKSKKGGQPKMKKPALTPAEREQLRALGYVK